MTVCEPPGSQPPGDDTALLTAALDHTWAWYDGRTGRALQVVSFYLVAIAVTGSAYTSAITQKDYGIAAALAIGGLGLTAIASAAGLREVGAASLAEPALAELQDRVAGRLGIDSIRLLKSEAPKRPRGTVINVTIGLALLVNTGGLVYALIH
jgi:hypothetical protein